MLGCLIEKKELTPDVYPLTLNGAHAAANQKTARDPVMALELAEVHRALKLLDAEGTGAAGIRLARRALRAPDGAGILADAVQIALVGVLMLRGPQTPNELFARAERMAASSRSRRCAPTSTS